MPEGPGLRPDDLATSADISATALLPLADRDWDINAYELEWSCRHTAGHISRALLSYSLHLANRAPAQIDYPRNDDPALSIPQLIGFIKAMAGVLVQVVRAAPRDARGAHPQGMADVAGFIAMGCSETLIHSADITKAFGVPFDPPTDLCDRVTRRLFPWAPPDVDGWSALRWGNGRIALPTRARLGPDWGWQCAPLSEWDGTIKKESR